MIKSLRFQITAWYLLFFTVVFLLFGLFLFSVSWKSMYERLDDTLDSQVSTAINLVESEFGESNQVSTAVEEAVSELRVRGVLIAVFDGQQVLASAGLNRPEYLGLAAQAGANGRADLVTTVPARGHMGDRVRARKFYLGGRPLVLLAAQNIDPIATDLHQARSLFFITLPIVVLIVGAGGFVLATRSLAPVRRMADQAKNLTDRNLGGGLDAGAASEELQLLADSFNELLARLDRSFASMRRFVADASHELRTPLSVIRGEADVALAAGRTAAEYRESMVIIQDEARRLSRLVDDLLNLTRADTETVRLRVEAFYLNDLLAECCRSVQALANAKDVGLECCCREDVMFSGDQELLRRLVLNLLDNAIRYTPAGGNVTVSLENGAGDLSIAVSDTGIGIAPEAVPHVFERFYRADQARTREQGGFGLGLSIVKWIAESHNGTVQLSSQPGVGSTFTVLLHQ